MNSRALPQGTRFGRYIIDRMVGSGTFGVVYAARLEGLPKLVALKVLHADHIRNAEVMKRFHAEATTISELRHPHIVDVTDVGAELGVPFLAMEFLEGETLRDRLDRERVLPLDLALDLLFPIFSAVSKVHTKGIVHRDLKPDNIVLAATLPGRVHPKLLDFGVAKVSQGGPGMTREGAAVGTPYYMSPEQAEEAREADAASDQWSLAVLLYRCITGQQPFEGRSVVKILHAILEDDPPLPSTLLPTCPAVVERALLRAMSKKPGDRFPSVRAFGAVLLPFASRRTREDWREEFIDAEASTLDLEPKEVAGGAGNFARRRLTQAGPVFQPPTPVVMEPDLYEDDVRTDVKIGASAHDTLESGAPAMTAPIAPIAPIAPVAPALPAPPWGAVAGPMRTVAVPPPPAALTSPSAPPLAMMPLPPPPAGTLSHGAHSLSPLAEERRAQRRVLAAGVFAFLSVAASAYVFVKREDVGVAASRPPPARRVDAGVARTTAAVMANVAAPPTEEAAGTATAGEVEAGTVVEATHEEDQRRGRRERGRRGVRGATGGEALPLEAPTAENASQAGPVPAPSPMPEAQPTIGPAPEPEEEIPERLTRRQVTNVFLAAQTSVQRCVAERAGQIVVQVGFTSEGVSTTVVVNGAGILSEQSRVCVAEVMRGLRFPRSRYGSSGVTFPYLIR